MRSVYIAIIGALCLSACTTPATYELCDAPQCGDNVTIEIEE